MEDTPWYEHGADMVCNDVAELVLHDTDDYLRILATTSWKILGNTALNKISKKLTKKQDGCLHDTEYNIHPVEYIKATGW